MLLKRYLATLLLLIICTPSYADQYEGRVIKVIDGDTIWVKLTINILKYDLVILMLLN